MPKQITIINGWSKIEIPELADGAEIYNAARPFPCHKNWIGEFVHGVFYGAIWPNHEYADEYRRRAIELDASRLVFVEIDEVESWAIEYCAKLGVDRNDFGFDAVAQSYLQHARKIWKHATQ